MAEPTAADRTVPPLVGLLPAPCQKDVTDLRRFIRDVRSQEAEAAPAVSPGQFRNVLLTGATGLVGRFVLHELLSLHPDLTVHCLVRADDPDHGHRRLREAMQHAEIWDEAYAPRIRAVVGDISRERFGLDAQGFAELCQQIDAVYHFAADLSLASSYATIREVNAASLRNVLELCLRTRLKHVFYASTMGVFPQYFCGFAREFRQSRIHHQMQPDLAAMTRVFPLGLMGYPWSKLAAEQGLLFAQQAGLPVAIFRLPQTGVASTGYSQADDITVRIFAAMADVEAMPPGVVFQNNETVDVLSSVCAAISLNPERRYTIYHCCNPQWMHHNLEPAEFGMYWREVSYEEFKRACQARDEESPLYGHWTLLDHFRPYWFREKDEALLRPVSDRALREDCPCPIKWAGLLTVLKRSHEWVLRYRDRWPHPIPRSDVDADALLTQAARYAERTGLPVEAIYPEWMLAGLRRLVESLEEEPARLRETSRTFVALDLSRNLHHNAVLAGERQQQPDIAETPIDRPVFIIGINRTGTTFLHRLLVRDPRFRALRGHELVPPVLAPDLSDIPESRQRMYLEDALSATDLVRTLEGLHHVGVNEPEEEFQLLNLAFASWAYTIRYHVPAYAHWLSTTCAHHAYAHHRRTLQHFEHRRRERHSGHPGQWLLKMPFHLMELESLLAAYPDALFIQTHREPVQFMGSWTSLVTRLRSVSMEPRSLRDEGAEQLAFMGRMLDGAVAFRENHPELADRWLDVNYFDLVQDPMATVRGIYEHFNWPLPQHASASMTRWLRRQAQHRRQEVRHSYALEDFGLTPDAVDQACARYLAFNEQHGIRWSPP